ncbi:MAG: ethylbenzene dehydrogenase-related protein [Trueperaceae bacterium]|nr:ethylbenzene dehydrogenase-related protein [Trueperaceae bacterium]
MRFIRTLATSIVALSLVALLGLATAQNGVLQSVKVPYPPLIDGNAGEALWSEAPVLELETYGAGHWGAANESETTVQLRSVHTDDAVYFLARWADPTFSLDRKRWIVQDGTWVGQDQTPLREGGASTFYEDKLAFLWVIDAESIVEDESFWPTYFEPEDAPDAGYERPVKAMPDGELLDLWHFKLVRNNYTTPSQVDDQYVDDTLDAEANRNAGRKGDPGDGGYYSNAKEYTTPDGETVTGPWYYVPGNPNVYIVTHDMVERGEAVEIEDYEQLTSFAEGTRLPSVIGRPFTGSRGDIRGKDTWSDGWHTLEIGRALDTGTPDVDVVFSDLSVPYFFGVGSFDNSQIAHGVTDLIGFEFID